ncbi:MAG TPA: M20/M25/M40 family metallo-hydrolase, partial [Xanthobacteraceae bacterium]|nr:M20/M25/M40 family metallo-hydrolase [Xanthobacteraceae bacterium]
MTNTFDQSIDLGGMIEGIRRWVVTESPTANAVAVNRMIDLVAADLDGLPVHIERIGGERGYADMLKVRAGQSDAPGILVLSHIDTVHPIGTIAGALPFRRDGDNLYGPGLYDMKGGAYIAFDAMRAVARAGTMRLPIV